MEVIGENVRACGVDEEMVSDRDGWRGRIRVANSIYEEKKQR